MVEIRCIFFAAESWGDKRQKRLSLKGATIMANAPYETYEEKKSGGLWFFLPVLIFLLVGAGLSIAAYVYAEPELTAAESIGAGFGGLAGIIIGLFGAIIGLIFALFATILGLIFAAGSIAFAIFLVASPLIAVILFILLIRERKDRNRVVEALNNTMR